MKVIERNSISIAATISILEKLAVNQIRKNPFKLYLTMKKNNLNLLFLVLFAMPILNSQCQVFTDNSIPAGTERSKKLITDTIFTFLKNADTIQAFRFKIENNVTCIDPQGVQGYKVEKRIPILAKKHVDSLLAIMTDQNSYLWDDVLPRSFIVDLGFSFIDGNQTVTVLISTISGAIRFYHSGNSHFMLDCSPSSKRFLAFGKKLFPQSFLPSEDQDIVIDTSRKQIEHNKPLLQSDALIADQNFHIVKAGETLKSIAKIHSLTRKHLKKLNPDIHRNKDLEVGIKLKISF